ncbi:MAG: hypothetical protein ACLPIG_03780 [Methylocella sp.]
MSDPGGAASETAKAFGDPFGTLAGVVAGFVPEGPLRTLVLVVEGLCAALAPFIYKYYLGVLAQGSQPEGSIERQEYDRLRAGLAGDNLAARLYAKWLTAFLDGIEHFFGDAGIADRTLFPHAFGLKKPAPLWTAPALDRCLLLALIYPIATIFLIWAISGHVGPAEAALRLTPHLSGWRRGLTLVAVGVILFEIWRFRIPPTRAIAPFELAFIVTVAVAVANAVAGNAAVAFVGVAPFWIARLANGFGAVAAVSAISFMILLPSVLALPDDAPIVYAYAFVLTAIGSFFVVDAWNRLAIKRGWQGSFLAFVLLAMIVVCFLAAAFLAHLETWNKSGPMLLYLGLLTLFNAPFEWASLGLTRALLRRGLELGGWWPYLLALADACLAGIIIALLAPTMVIGVQAFDELAVNSGGETAAVLPLLALFDDIAQNPGAPEYWWAYALLLSAMIPSLVNLAIGGMAFSRGVPGLGRLLLRWIPEGREVPDYRRPLAALILTGQMFAGAFLGFAAQAFLAWGLIFHVMPWVGLDLLDMARAVAAFDLPARIGQLVARIP